MAYRNEPTFSLEQIKPFSLEIETDYVDPILGRSLAEHLKTYWLVRSLYDYSAGYEANKVREVLEPQKFTEKDWIAIAKVCGFSRSWAIKQLEQYEA